MKTIGQMSFLKRRVPVIEFSPFNKLQGDQQGEGSPKGQLDHLEGEKSQKSPETDPLDGLAQVEPTAPVNSRQQGRWGIQIRRQTIKEGLVYKKRKMGVKEGLDEGMGESQEEPQTEIYSGGKSQEDQYRGFIVAGAPG